MKKQYIYKKITFYFLKYLFSYSFSLHFIAFVFELKRVKKYLSVLYRSGLCKVFDNLINIDTSSTRGSTISELISKGNIHIYSYIPTIKFITGGCQTILTFATVSYLNISYQIGSQINVNDTNVVNKRRKQHSHYKKFVLKQTAPAR